MPATRCVRARSPTADMPRLLFGHSVQFVESPRRWGARQETKFLSRRGVLKVNLSHHQFVALAIWVPDKTLAKTCADFSDLEIGPDGSLYLLSDKSSTIVRLHDLPAGGGTAALVDAWRLGDLDGKPEGLAFTA